MLRLETLVALFFLGFSFFLTFYRQLFFFGFLVSLPGVYQFPITQKEDEPIQVSKAPRKSSPHSSKAIPSR